MSETKGAYLLLFHGRTNPNDDLQTWGIAGPRIGPCQVSMTYGSLKIHPLDWEDVLVLPTNPDGDLIWFDGVWYADAEVQVIADGPPGGDGVSWDDCKRMVYGWDEACAIVNAWEESRAKERQEAEEGDRMFTCPACLTKVPGVGDLYVCLNCGDEYPEKFIDADGDLIDNYCQDCTVANGDGKTLDLNRFICSRCCNERG